MNATMNHRSESKGFLLAFVIFPKQEK